MKRALRIILLSALSLLAVKVIICLLSVTIFLRSCQNFLGSHKNEPDGHIICAEKYVPEYIENKYGFTPEIVSSERGTTVALVPIPRKTNEVFLKLSDGEREFDVRAYLTSEDSGLDDINFSDNYQSDEIISGLGKLINSKLPGLAAIEIKAQEQAVPNYYAKYYDGENLLDFLGGMFLHIRAYYVNHDFSDASQLDFFEILDGADVGYDYMFISCRSKEAVEYVQPHFFYNDYEVDYFSPYIEGYISGFRNSQTKETPVYKKLNIYDTGEFLYSVKEVYSNESDSFIKFDQQTDYTLEVSRTDSFDEQHEAVSPCWVITGDPAYLQIFVPLRYIDRDFKVLTGSRDYTYDIRGECKPFDYKNTVLIYIVGEYATFEASLQGGSSSIGIFEE